jgi:hypothetical protein
VKKIEYKITFGDGTHLKVTVEARGINTGAAKALGHGLRFAKRQRKEFHSIEFSQVIAF